MIFSPKSRLLERRPKTLGSQHYIFGTKGQVWWQMNISSEPFPPSARPMGYVAIRKSDETLGI
jgi:hypothetical protein